MPYLPELIPDESKVLPEYFNNRSIISNNSQQKSNPLLWLVAIFFFIAAVAMIDRLFVAVVLVSVGFICTPIGKNWLERAGQFKLTSRIRVLFCFLILLLNLPLTIYYQEVEKTNARLEKVRIQRAVQYTADSLKHEIRRKDSLSYYIAKSLHSKPKDGLIILSVADKFAITNLEKDSVKQIKQTLTIKLVDIMVASSNYQSALDTLQQVLKESPGVPKLLYSRAICYFKLGKIQLAVNDLDTAKTNGFKPADALYNKINPVRKRVAYYETLCNDGSSSSATGRGACSWHGGVRQWDHPVYEEYRKY